MTILGPLILMPTSLAAVRRRRASRQASPPGAGPLAGAPSRPPVPIAPATLGPHKPDESVDGGASVGVRVEPDPARRADPAPVAGEEGAAEEIGPDGQAVVPPFVLLGANADERRRLREQRELDWGGQAQAGFPGFGHLLA